MGILYARVGGAWVPISAHNEATIRGGNSITVDSTDPTSPLVSLQSPAYAGIRRDGAPGIASFSNSTITGKEGMTVESSGFIRFIGALVGGENFQWHSTTPPDHMTSTWIASLLPDRFQIQDISMGRHPAHNMFGIWIQSASGAGSFMMLRGGGGELFLNCGAGSSVALRQNNVDMLSATSAKVHASGGFQSNWNSPDNNWPNAHILANPSASNYSQARIAFQSPGVAPQIRAMGAEGELLACINNQSTGFCAVNAAAFNVASTITIKRDVRSLNDRERIIVVHHPVDADVVPQPDVMGLRPVAFRPKVPALRLVPVDGVSYTEDPETWRSEPQVGILGHEGTRERLGLIAEEVATVIPSAVTHNSDGDTLAIDYAQITVALLDHVQRLTDEVATLRYRVAELEGIS